ncbi:protein phosphatase, Mg2+/Mn2+ dependent, 1Nb (putative) isoform X1 [Alosa alosa]|uniref:protein phosphatase, Mg2+/Mn2+ dependent, 1Nb (putative) isoform X1 n=1 Tax=Alosa alosa TaxID=278164 RepID=UPI0020152FDC|nr:protein phosphatase, Mg2+/Mn2+ dependent, 1Nb (putative) isoform X1 [Alosa alosa]
MYMQLRGLRGLARGQFFYRRLVKLQEQEQGSGKGGRGGAVRGEQAEGEEGAASEEEEGGAIIPCPYLDRPVLDKLLEEGFAPGGGVHFACACMQGWRATMEDFHNCFPQLCGALADWAFFAVFDGHAGSVVAEHCSRNLLEHILATGSVGLEEDVERVTEGIHEGFLSMDKQLHSVATREGWERGGTTVVSTLLTPQSIYFANLGDSRALLCRGGRVAFATADHKPYGPAEKERIERAGGSVALQRVNGSLAVSRALGDFGYKTAEWRSAREQMVSPEPEVTVVERSPMDEFLILACDGVWDAISNDDLCEFVSSRLRVCTDLREVCSQVIDLCLYKGSLDNISVVLVCFPAAPQLCPEALHQEAELDDLLESKVAEIFEELSGRGEDPDLLSVLTVLASTVIPGLPPGGGLQSKRNCIISAYYQQKEARQLRLSQETGGASETF